jgi:hypothetical protein
MTEGHHRLLGGLPKTWSHHTPEQKDTAFVKQCYLNEHTNSEGKNAETAIVRYSVLVVSCFLSCRVNSKMLTTTR